MAETMPTNVNFISSQFNLRFNTQLFESPLSQQIQRSVLDGPKWVAQYTLPHMKRETAAEWQAFFMKLQGMKVTFNAYDPEGKTPRGVATGTPLVKGASQTGTSLDTDGWTSGVTGILKKGDYFSVGGELKIITDDINSDGSGNATLTFQPALRNSPSDNAAITVTDATCEMILSSDVESFFLTNKNNVYTQKTFGGIEVF